MPVQTELLQRLLDRYLPYLIIIGGLGLILLAIAVDFVGLGDDPGFGRSQIKLAVIGAAVSLLGSITITSVRRRFLLKHLIPSVTYHHPPESIFTHFKQIILIAIWFGLAMGLTDLAYLADQKFVEREELRFGVDLVWMAPLAGLSITGVTGLILGLVSWRWSRLGSFRYVFGAFVFLGVLNLLFAVFANIHMIAVLILAAGIATAASRLLGGHSSRLYGLFHRTSAALVALVAVIVAVFLGWGWTSQRQSLADLPPLLQHTPNVLLITLDTVRARSLSLYGYERPTSPGLEQFAEEGVTFDWPIATAPWTLPSHGSIFTGRFSHEISAGLATPLDDTHPTLAEVLTSNGYDTAGFTANYFFGWKEFGLDRGFAHYEDYGITLGHLVRSSSLAYYLLRDRQVGRLAGHFRGIGRKDARALNHSFLGWLSNREEPARPFFAFINYYDAHGPYVPPPDWALKFTGTERPKKSWDGWCLPLLDEARRVNDTYDASLAYLDYQVSLLLDELEERDLLDNTLIIITSDHGEQFGEHGLTDHGNSLYLELIHVPLVIRFPDKVPSNIRINEPVSLVDIPVTVLDLIGIKDKTDFSGSSLARHWEDATSPASGDDNLILSEVEGQPWEGECNPVRKGDMRSLVRSFHLYIINGDGTEELYDIVKDPLEQNNLVQTEDGDPHLERYRRILEGLTTKVARP